MRGVATFFWDAGDSGLFDIFFGSVVTRLIVETPLQRKRLRKRLTFSCHGSKSIQTKSPGYAVKRLCPISLLLYVMV